MAIKYLIPVVFCVSVFLTAFLPSQNDFSWILCSYSLAFGSYALLIKQLAEYSHRILMYIFLFVTVGLLFSFPNLSDDIYRFYWDGMLVSKGISPYSLLPTEVYAEGIINDHHIFAMLNSPEYYSIYPPLNQLFFTSAFMLAGSVFSFSFWLKVIYLIIMLIGWRFTLGICEMLKVDIESTYLFFLNPLVLVEGLGNLHIELVMVSFLAMTIYMYQRKAKPGIISAFYSCAIGFKINPLLISPFFWFNQDARWRRKLTIWTIVLTVFLMLPIVLWSGQSGFLSSIDLYFRKFEFNGSIYYLMRFLGRMYAGYNLIAQIGPLLALTVVAGILWKSLKVNDRSTASLVNLALWAWTLYLFCSTTVHPWYIIPLIFFSVFNGKIYPLVWSYLITWTYINYSYKPYYENLWLVAVEYIILGSFMLYEFGYYPLIKERLHSYLK